VECLGRELHDKKISELKPYYRMFGEITKDSDDLIFVNILELRAWAIACVKEMRRVRDIEFSACEYWLIDKFEITEEELR